MRNFIKKNLFGIGNVFSNKKYLLIFVMSASLIGTLFYYFTNFAVTAGNLGIVHAYVFVIFDVLISILFGFYVALLVFRYDKIRSILSSASITGVIGSSGGAVAGGCAACSVTLASYLGLASVIAALPFYGLELKIIGIGLLIFSIVSLVNDPKLCKIGYKIKIKRRLK